MLCCMSQEFFVTNQHNTNNKSAPLTLGGAYVNIHTFISSVTGMLNSAVYSGYRKRQNIYYLRLSVLKILVIIWQVACLTRLTEDVRRFTVIWRGTGNPIISIWWRSLADFFFLAPVTFEKSYFPTQVSVYLMFDLANICYMYCTFHSLCRKCTYFNKSSS